MRGNAAESFLKNFIKKQLPDYIYSVFSPGLHFDGNVFKPDVLLIIPHMGIFVLEIYSPKALRYEDGVLYGDYYDEKKVLQVVQKRDQYCRAVSEHIKERYNITPLVHALDCYPFFNKANSGYLSRELDPYFTLWAEDFSDDIRFLSKLFQLQIELNSFRKKYASKDSNICFYDDITDEMAYTIYRYWNKSCPPKKRPKNPPMVFMSYSTKNQIRATTIQKELESRGVFVWKSPLDIPIGGFHRDEEDKNIPKCTVLLLLLSMASQDSDEVRYEFDKALENNKTIFPLIIEDFELNDYYKEKLKTIQYRTMHENDNNILDEIVSLVKTIHNKESGDRI